MRSNKPKDINYRDAVMDPDTRLVFIQSMLHTLTQDFIHLRSILTDLQKLHAITKDFVEAIVSSTKKMPYSLRYIAREILDALKVEFSCLEGDSPSDVVTLGEISPSAG